MIETYKLLTGKYDQQVALIERRAASFHKDDSGILQAAILWKT